MAIPKNRKFKKDFKGRKGVIRSITYSGAFLDKGIIGLKAMEPGRITEAQIEAVRRVITRYLKRTGKVFIPIFPHKPVTKKPAEVRMGSGKGSVEQWVAIVKPGRILFELDGVSPEVGHAALSLARYKLPFKVKVVRPNLLDEVENVN